jgi:signal transduction histidine kinase
MIDPMRWLNTLLAAFGIALLGILVIIIAVPDRSGPEPTRFDRVKLCVEDATPTRYSRKGLYYLLSSAPSPNQDCRPDVPLPHLARAESIKVVRYQQELLQRAWYTLDYTVPPHWGPGDALMIYAPRLMATAWQARVNGRIVADDLDDWHMTWNRPLAVTMAPGELRPGEQVHIALAIAFEPQTGQSMSRISVGAAGFLATNLALRDYLQSTMPFASIIMLLAMALFFLTFWLARRSERTHLLLTCTCIAWSVTNLQYVLPRWDDRAVDAWYGAIIQSSTTWATWFIYLFVLQIDRRFSGAFARVMPPFVLVMTLLTLPVFRLSSDTDIPYEALNAAVAALVTARICWLAIRGGSRELRVIAAASIVVVATGAHDLGILAQAIDAEGIYLLPYSALLMFGAFLFAVQRRYVSAIDKHEELSKNLAERLAAREAELQANHARLLELERMQALANERQRLMRDMHDGLGSALTASLAMLEQGDVNRTELAGLLQESVDDLRAVIDSLAPTEGDLATLLATLRFRLSRRLEIAGLKVDWEMGDLPSVPWLGPPQALQVMRIVQESLTNVLKHAAATHIAMSTRREGEWIEVCIADNGRGFSVDDTAGHRGRGLRNLRQRAGALGAQLDIDSRPQRGTTVRLLLPLRA